MLDTQKQHLGRSVSEDHRVARDRLDVPISAGYAPWVRWGCALRLLYGVEVEWRETA